MTLPRPRSKSSRSSKSKRPKPGSTRKARRVREVALAKVTDDLSKYLRLAAGGEIVITRHGRPAGVLIGFESDDDWFDYRLEHHPEFLRRIAASRTALEQGRGIRLEELRDVGPTSRWSRRRRALAPQLSASGRQRKISSRASCVRGLVEALSNRHWSRRRHSRATSRSANFSDQSSQ